MLRAHHSAGGGGGARTATPDKNPRGVRRACAGFCGVAALMRRVFKDLKLLSIIMLVWLCIVLLVMTEIGVFNNSTFVAWGPRDTLSFLHVPIDTEYKYGLLLAMIMVHTFISGQAFFLWWLRGRWG
jgi:hypothetical protein